MFTANKSAKSRANAVRRYREGELAKEIAADIHVSTNLITTWAREQDLKEGRPAGYSASMNAAANGQKPRGRKPGSKNNANKVERLYELYLSYSKQIEIIHENVTALFTEECHEAICENTATAPDQKRWGELMSTVYDERSKVISQLEKMGAIKYNFKSQSTVDEYVRVH